MNLPLNYAAYYRQTLILLDLMATALVLATSERRLSPSPMPSFTTTDAVPCSRPMLTPVAANAAASNVHLLLSTNQRYPSDRPFPSLVPTNTVFYNHHRPEREQFDHNPVRPVHRARPPPIFVSDRSESSFNDVCPPSTS